MIQSLQALFKQATRRRLRIRAGLVIACWLLLNLQLAVAAHHGGQQQPAAPQVQIHHIVDGMMNMPGMENVGQKVICEKHCDPDTAQPNSLTSLQLNALPSETALLVVSPQQETCAERMDWRTPPVTGPRLRYASAVSGNNAPLKTFIRSARSAGDFMFFSKTLLCVRPLFFCLLPAY